MPPTLLCASGWLVILRGTCLHICVYLWGLQRACGAFWWSKKGQKQGKIACFAVPPPIITRPLSPFCPHCLFMIVKHYTKWYSSKIKPAKVWGTWFGALEMTKTHKKQRIFKFLGFLQCLLPANMPIFSVSFSGGHTWVHASIHGTQGECAKSR